MLAALAETQRDDQRRARVQQLEGRLGLRLKARPSGLLGRLVWVERQHGSRVRRALEIFLLRSPWGPGSAIQPPGWSWRVRRSRHETVEDKDPLVFVSEDFRVEPVISALVPWLGLQLRRADERDQLVEGLRFLIAWSQQQSDVLDYLREERPADLMSLSLDELTERSGVWHEQFVRSGGVGTPAEPGVVVYTWPDGWKMERLVTKRQLEDEGESMAHCVGGYWPPVRDGQTVILSLRKPDGVPVATAEVDTDAMSVEQLKGPHNDSVDHHEGERAHEALAALGVSMSPQAMVLPDALVKWIDATHDPDGPMAWMDTNELPDAYWEGTGDALLQMMESWFFWKDREEALYSLDLDAWREAYPDLTSRKQFEDHMNWDIQDASGSYWAALDKAIEQLNMALDDWMVSWTRGHRSGRSIEFDGDTLEIEVKVDSDQAGDPWFQVRENGEDAGVSRHPWNPLVMLRKAGLLLTKQEASSASARRAHPGGALSVAAEVAMGSGLIETAR